MKTFRMSESSHRHNARKALSVFAHTGTPAASDIHAEAPLRGRNFRRANGLSRAAAARLEMMMFGVDGTIVRPTLTVEMDRRTRTIIRCEMI